MCWKRELQIPDAKFHQNQNIIPLKMAKIEFLHTKTVTMLWAWRNIFMKMSGKLLAALVNFKVTSVFSSAYFSEVFILTLREMTNSYSNYLHDNMKGWNMECLTAHIVDWDQKLLIEWKDFFQRVFAKKWFCTCHSAHAWQHTCQCPTTSKQMETFLCQYLNIVKGSGCTIWVMDVIERFAKHSNWRTETEMHLIPWFHIWAKNSKVLIGCIKTPGMVLSR